MRTLMQAVIIPPETAEFAEELRRIYSELARTGDGSGLNGECSPPLDVYETDDTIEIVMDLPGVPQTAVQIVAKGNAVLIAGKKAPRRGRGDSSFHLVERGYGRFARVVRLARACDTAQARATVAGGELHVSLPKLRERRGRSVPISITGEQPVA
jgi:HSP20 family protein